MSESNAGGSRLPAELLDLIEPERGAYASVRGYLYQSVLAVRRWLELAEGELLLVEGNEDVDRWARDGTVHEQVKDLRERVTARSLRKTIAAFVRGYCKGSQLGQRHRFVFTTTAAIGGNRVDDSVPADVLKEWADADRTDAVAQSLATLLGELKDAATDQAVAWLDEAGGWRGFLDAVEWRVEAPGLDELRLEVQDVLGSRPGSVPPGLVEPRLLAEVMRASAFEETDLRVLDVARREELLAQTRGEIEQWWEERHDERQRLERLLRSCLREELEAQEVRNARRRLDEALSYGIEPAPRAAPGRELLPSQLLRAGSRVIPYQERPGIEGRLEHWLQTSPPLSLFILTAPGGAGKTRTLVQWCERLRVRGLCAGFLRHTGLPAGSAMPPEWQPIFAGEGARVVVIDYADGRLELLQRFFRAAAQHADRVRSRPLRIVLLERHVPQGLLDDLAGREATLEPVVLEAPRVELEPLPASMEQLFKLAQREFTAALGAAAPRAQAPVPDLTAPEFQRPLYVLMTALAAARGETVRGAADVLDATLAHERRLWQRAVDDETASRRERLQVESAVATMVTLATLRQGLGSEQEARDLLADQGGLDPAARGREETVLELLHALYPGEPGDGSEQWLAPLTPDLLGEHQVAHALDAQGGAALVHAALGTTSADARLPSGTAESVLAFLIRLAGSHPSCERHVADLTSGLANLDIAVAERLVWACPEQTLLLAEFACAANQLVVEHLRGKAGDATAPDHKARLATHLSNLGVRLGDLGRREEALEATREAVAMRRQLAEARPDAFLPDLASSLNNLGIRLSNLGRREEALGATVEAVEIRRQLAEARPDAFLPDLAMGLNNMGGDLSDLGRREEALEATREAVDIQRKLAAARPDAFLPDLAMSLNNLGVRVGDLGRREEALGATVEAVEIYRQLAEARPDAFLPDLAMGLNNLGMMLSNLGRREDALEATVEAVEIYRQLAGARPDAFLPGLARSLNNLGIRLSNLGRREEALEATREAVEVYRQLAEARPDVLLPDLAGSVNNLGTMLSNLGRREDALEATVEAVEIYRQLAEARPDAFLPDLAMGLNNMGGDLSDLGRREEALEATREAVDIQRKLAAARPDAFLPDLAMSLNNLGVRVGDLGRREEALEATREALDIYRKLADARPDAFLPDLAKSLNNLGAMLSSLGRREEALEATREAVEIYRQLAKARPDAFLPDLAMGLNNLGMMLSNLGRREDALEATREAVEIYRQLAKARPDSFLSDLAVSLNNLAVHLREADRHADAADAAQEALGIHTPLLVRYPARFAESAARAVGNYRAACDAAGIAAEAGVLAPFRDALPELFDEG